MVYLLDSIPLTFRRILFSSLETSDPGFTAVCSDSRPAISTLNKVVALSSHASLSILTLPFLKILPKRPHLQHTSYLRAILRQPSLCLSSPLSLPRGRKMTTLENAEIIGKSFTDFSKKSTVLLLSGGQRWGWGVNFVDVLDCWEFKNTNFTFSYLYAKFSALHISRKILTDRLEILVCSWGMVGIVPRKILWKSVE